MAEMRKRAAKKEAESERRVPSIRPLTFWYVFLMLLVLWLWQDALRQVALRTIPYSEFKACLARGEVSECTIEQDEIAGKVTPKPGPIAAPGGKAGRSSTAPFLFRSVRIEDPKLVEDLQKAGIEYSGVRPRILTQFLWAWLLPIGAIVLLWWAISSPTRASSCWRPPTVPTF